MSVQNEVLKIRMVDHY